MMGFSAPPVVIRRPIVIRRPGKCAPFPPSLRPCSAVCDSGVDLHDNRGVTRGDGQRMHNSPAAESLCKPQITAEAPNHCRVRRNVPTMSQILSSVQCICFQKASGSNTGAPKLLWVALWRPPTCYAQGRNKDGWRPAWETNLAPPYLNLRSYGSKFTVLKEVFVTLLEIFGAPAVIRRPHSGVCLGNCYPLAPARYTLNGIVVFAT